VVFHHREDSNVKIKEQELVWANQVAKVVESILLFEKKKTRIS
jgi:hypothetical protein